MSTHLQLDIIYYRRKFG